MNPECLNTPIHGNAHDEGNIEPVHMLVPVGLGDGGVGDVRLLRIVGSVSIGLRSFGHWRGLGREELRLHCHITGSRLMGWHDEDSLCIETPKMIVDESKRKRKSTTDGRCEVDVQVVEKIQQKGTEGIGGIRRGTGGKRKEIHKIRCCLNA